MCSLIRTFDLHRKYSRSTKLKIFLVLCSLIRTFAHKIYFTVELLQNIKYPEDLRKLAVDQLPQLCQELREDIVKELSVNPGHLASSLGVVELTVALHYVYNTPEDRIVWDVGHQAYGHKILTGRREQFCTNRKLGGLKPFPSPEESEYDTFMCGHAATVPCRAVWPTKD